MARMCCKCWLLDVAQKRQVLEENNQLAPRISGLDEDMEMESEEEEDETAIIETEVCHHWSLYISSS